MPSIYIAWLAGSMNVHTFDYGCAHSSDIRGKLCHSHQRRFSSAPHENALIETWLSARVNAESQHCTFHRRQHKERPCTKRKSKTPSIASPLLLTWVLGHFCVYHLSSGSFLSFNLLSFHFSYEGRMEFWEPIVASGLFFFGRGLAD